MKPFCNSSKAELLSSNSSYNINTLCPLCLKGGFEIEIGFHPVLEESSCR